MQSPVKNMARKKGKAPCCGPAGTGPCCRVESLASVDERGQMVLPKELRDRAKIRAGDKMALVTWESDGKVCCIVLIRADEFTGMVKGMLGPVMKDLVKSQESAPAKQT